MEWVEWCGATRWNESEQQKKVERGSSIWCYE